MKSIFSCIDAAFKTVGVTDFPGFIIVDISVLTIQIEKAFNMTYKRDESNESATIKRYGLT